VVTGNTGFRRDFKNFVEKETLVHTPSPIPPFSVGKQRLCFKNSINSGKKIFMYIWSCKKYLQVFMKNRSICLLGKTHKNEWP
jgi:hypothetical protein